LGAQHFVGRNRRSTSHFLGQGFRCCEHVVTWGLGHRTLGQIDAIGVDEIQCAKGHKYLTLVYRIDIGVTRPHGSFPLPGPCRQSKTIHNGRKSSA
jgi:hypothetical protein